MSCFTGCTNSGTRDNNLKPLSEYTLEEIEALPTYTFQDIQNDPVLLETDLDLAIASNVSSSFDYMQRIRDWGLEGPIIDDIFNLNYGYVFSSPSYILSYAASVYARNFDSGYTEDVYISENYEDITFYIDSAYAEDMVSYTLYDPSFQKYTYNMFYDCRDYIYDAETDTSSRDPNVYRILLQIPLYEKLYKVVWQDTGDTRVINVFDLYQPNYIVATQYVFKKSDGIYKLFDGESVEIRTGETNETPVYVGENDFLYKLTPTTTTTNRNTIIGNIEDTVLLVEIWSNTFFLHGLNSTTFAIESTKTYSGYLIGYRLFDDELMLLFDDRVVCIDKTLAITRETPLPTTIRNRILEDDFFAYCVGVYDVTRDLNTFIYSSSAGLILVDAKTNTETLLFEPYYFEGSTGERIETFTKQVAQAGPILFNYYYPKFSYDDTFVYALHFPYEGNADCAMFDLQTGEYTSPASLDDHFTMNPFELVCNNTRSFANYFHYSFLWGGTPYIGQSHFYIQTEHDSSYIYVFGFIDHPLQNTINIKDFYNCSFVTILSDGRLVFRTSDGTYAYTDEYTVLETLLETEQKEYLIISI